jgi:hypothetical protein
MLQWRHAIREDIPTPNTNGIVVFSSFFQCRFGLPACDFLRGLLDHYQIELVHLNSNSILQNASLSISTKLTMGFLQASHCSKTTSS